MATFYETALDRQGNALSGIQVTVYTDSALTTKATLTDVDTNPIDNPVETDDDGFFAFTTAAGTYTLAFALNGASVRDPLTIQVGGAQGDPGTPGTPGANGNTILSGSGVPGGGTGANGDFYFDTAASRLYGPKTAGAWGSGVSLIGPPGASGAGTGDMLAAQNLNDLANKATARTNLGVAIGVNVQAYDADLTTYAGITPSANVQSYLGAADYAAMRTLLGLVIGTNVQAYDADLTTWAGLTPSANAQSLVTAANYAAMRTLLGLVIGANAQAYSAVLDNVAAGTFDAALKPTESIIIAASDEATALTVGAGKVTFRMPYAFTVTAVRASLLTAQSSGSIFTVDINENPSGGGAVSILSTKLTIDNTEKTSTTAAAPPVISDASLADDAEITVDIDQVGSGTAVGLKITLIGHR